MHTEKWYQANRLAQLWLYRANIARENGNHELEQRHLKRAQRWLDELNKLDGLGD